MLLQCAAIREALFEFSLRLRYGRGSLFFKFGITWRDLSLV